jgi:hypothetical protein
MSSTHENKYDLESGREPDTTPFTLEFVFRRNVLDT